MDDIKTLEKVLFDKFLNQFNKQLTKVKYILQFASTYPVELSELKIQELVSSNDLFEHQKDWVWLVSKYEGLEKKFFQPYWVPLNRFSMDFFIDLSDELLPIFKVEYFPLEPYHYDKIVVFHSANDFLADFETRTDFEALGIKLTEMQSATFQRRMAFRNKMILLGKIPFQKEIDHLWIFDSQFSRRYELTVKSDHFLLTCLDVSPLICSLFPYFTKIKLLTSSFDKMDHVLFRDLGISILNTISNLCFAFSNVGLINIQYYHCTFPEYPDEYIKFDQNVFVWKTSDYEELIQFIETYDFLWNENKGVSRLF